MYYHHRIGLIVPFFKRYLKFILTTAVALFAAFQLVVLMSSASAAVTVMNQAELEAAIAGSEAEIVLGADIEVTSRVNITRSLTLNGNGRTVKPNYTFVNNTNNAALGIIGQSNVVVTDLTVDGIDGVNLHGINIFNSTNIHLINVISINNDKSGIVNNGSTVTVTNIKTANNGWHGINVDKGSAPSAGVLTVQGSSDQTDILHIYVDNTANGSVNDVDNQYVASHINLHGEHPNDRVYMLKPVGEITSPTAGQVVSGSVVLGATYEDWDNNTNDDNVQWAVRANTCTSGMNTVAGNVDGFNTAASWDGAQFSASLDVSSWADGSYCFVFNPIDDYGDVRETVVFTVDTTAPSVPSITFPNPGQNFTSTPILNSWTAATDSGSGVAKYQVAYQYDDKHSFGSSTCPGLTIAGYTGFIGCRDANGLSRNHVAGAGEQGGVTIWVRAVDAAGNVSDWSAPVHYYYDATAPSVPVNGWPHNVYLNSNVFDYTWDPSTDNVSDVTYEYQAAINPVINSGVITGGSVFWQNWVHGNASQNPLLLPKIPSVGTSDGTWSWQVRAVDAAGNKSAWSEVWQYTLDSQAPAAPTSLGWTDSDSNTVAHDGYTNLYNGTAFWAASSSGDVSHYIYKYWNDISGSPYNDEASAWTSNTGGAALPGAFNQGEGKHYFCVVAVDHAGNQSVCSDVFAVTYDVTAPVVAVDSAVVNPGSPQLTGTVDDADATVEVEISGNTYTAVNNGDGTWTLPAGVITPGLIPNVYDVVARATDQAGNVGVDTTEDELVVATELGAATDVPSGQAPARTSPDNGDTSERGVLGASVLADTGRQIWAGVLLGVLVIVAAIGLTRYKAVAAGRR